MDEIWSGDLAVLVQVAEMYERTPARFPTEKLLETFPTEQHDDVRHSLRRLGAHGYIDALTAGPTMGDPRVEVLAIRGVTEKGLRAVGAYPDALFAAIDEAVENAPDAEERSKIQAVRSALAGLSLNTLSGLATVLIAKFTDRLSPDFRRSQAHECMIDRLLAGQDRAGWSRARILVGTRLWACRWT